ncbi:hypothetical protein ACFOZ0_21740 [Streptomyces yaanensis]|uniref:DUF7737 domain-containing protein n=1 Tax=Streptomyces yaanensis TaxID=1142239 RepID=A0ABV7SIY8_9ACTN|nr:hypothetical protein [Streptomyces sp. CGMCC 4.7035]WNB97547.1 hypothetical protein Q2K21_05350 [Streptomyces sp. CGMCC 4.7035]
MPDERGETGGGGAGPIAWCIVPSRRKGDGKVFLSFEDDRLSPILSKAFLLAAHTKITGGTTLRQAKGGD